MTLRTKQNAHTCALGCVVHCVLVAAFSMKSVQGAERPELTRIFPAGGQAGTVVEVEASGKFPVWPLQVWSDCDSIRWSLEEKTGKLKAAIDSNAKPGLHWLRLHHPSGATAVHPFLVSNTFEQIEVEPNNRLAEATLIDSFPRFVHGVLSKRGEVDMYSVVLSAGQRLVATIDAERLLHSPLDATLQILDSEGFVLAENLDHFGLDPFIDLIAPRDGKYMIRVFGFPATPDQTIAFGGNDAWIYRLRIQSDVESLPSMPSLVGHKTLTLEADQATSRESAAWIQPPSRIVGKFEQQEQKTFLRFEAKSGEHYRLQLFARERGSELDATVAILDAQGKQLSKQDDVGNERDPDLRWKSPADGEYTIEIEDFHKAGGKNFDFEIAVCLQVPDFKLSIPSDLIQATVGKDVDIEVKIDREADFSGEIIVSLEGELEGMECPSVKSIHGSDTAKKVTLRLKSMVPFQGPVRVIARAVALGDSARLAQTEKEKPIWLSSVAE